MIHLHLHREYILSSIKKYKKISQQFVKSLCVTERIDWLIYQLNISLNWEIHNIILIAHLKPATKTEKDSYKQLWSNHSETVIVNEVKKFKIA